MTAVSTIVVHCHDASHKAKRPQVYVTTFTRGPLGWTHGDSAKPLRYRAAATEWLDGETLMGPVGGGKLHGRENVNNIEDERLRVRLRCRSCKRPVVVRAGKLDAALDQIADAGRDHVTLSELRAILAVSGR